MKELTLDKWKRKEQFHYFNSFENPNFSVTANICIDGLIQFKKEHTASLHLLYHYFMLKAMNEVEEFKIRIIDEKIYAFDTVYGGTTILKEDETFSFVYLDWFQDFEVFSKVGKAAIQKIIDGEPFEYKENDYPIIHCTTVPWIQFTSVQNPNRGKKLDNGIPSVAFGKIFKQENKTMLPISVQAHHALLDGIHMGKFFTKMEEYCSATVLNLK
ncbi:hypothetical protein EI427_15975 [Flammeovirga pectinis]|uniref:Chloramphenicol acetyltransferase n=1 Tax=Flammeovirga pectinis TaxID=2494373 RepID=A0A3S9P625_9BACT|nr:CatA-like O-acetyltransferase [Flammeovirga pectinis]AZQ63667.1 hypothetical protein EI427_15975 [Flammeovirga pectinis]